MATVAALTSGRRLAGVPGAALLAAVTVVAGLAAGLLPVLPTGAAQLTARSVLPLGGVVVVPAPATSQPRRRRPFSSRRPWGRAGHGEALAGRPRS